VRGPSLRELSAVTVPEARSMLSFAVRELKRKAKDEHDRKKARQLREELDRVEKLKAQFEGMPLTRQLYPAPNLAEKAKRLGTSLAELHACPSVPRCDEAVRELADVSTAVHRLRSELQGGVR